MIRKLIAAAAFAAALSPAALAQDAPKFSTASTVGAVLDNPEAKAAFVKVFPEIADRPELEGARDMTFDGLANMAAEYFPADKIKELNTELAKIQ
ncbi:MAG: hypothetical protein B7Y90_06405 [Alphaproteobacteria bacterium 32-64-14]|nr:MAG: hypothetical protein B7Y90_06405 [Alphaproteobacteria bacterium 32-64-14]